MKKIFIRLLAFFAPMVPITLSAQQYTQPVPDHIKEIYVEDNARLLVNEGNEATISSATNTKVASVKGNRMFINGNTNATITLPAGYSISFVAEDRSQIIFSGSFGKRHRFSLVTNDYSSVTFSGSLADSLWAVDIHLRADDYSSIYSEIVMASFNCHLTANDYARINLACRKFKTEEGMSESEQMLSRDSHAQLEYNNCDDDTVRPFGQTKTVISTDSQNKQHTSQDLLVNKARKRRNRDVALNFAWGFHNWGADPIHGFSGVDGAASVRTSFNHIHLSVNYPLVDTRHVGLYLGLGLDWDKYKFTTPEVYFDPTIPAFTDGTNTDCSSRFLTRYVVVPVTLRIDLWRDWSITFGALPGIHWSGSHTGMRREYETSQWEELQKDQTINKYVYPYKLDLRATINYEGVGLYLQVPTLSTMKKEVQELYPIKFGLFFTLD